VLADVVGDRDVGRVEDGCGARLVQQACTALGIGLEARRQELEGDGPPQPKILGTIHFAHPPCPEVRDDAIMLNGCADHCCLA
jgi:hypothetical protein